MFVTIWDAAIYKPLYNTLILLVDTLPGHSVGMAIVLLTLGVKFALYPLAAKAIRAQQAMKELEPELKKIRDKHKDDKKLQAEHTMRLYQERKVTPFSGCLPIIIQIPIIIGLYYIFFKGLKIQPEMLYSFIPVPDVLDMHFLIFDLGAKSVLLAAIAGVAQYFQADISFGRQAEEKKNEKKSESSGEKPSFQEDFAKSMQFQTRYVFPIMISFIAYTTSAAVALYWATSNILSIVQELLARRKTKI